jgi:hypothetical protein
MTDIVTGVLDSVITALAVLVGAWFGNTLSKQAAREQVIFSRLQERREEIITRMYALVLNLNDAYLDVVNTWVMETIDVSELEARVTISKTEEPLWQAIVELKNFYQMNAIWLEPRMCADIVSRARLSKR